MLLSRFRRHERESGAPEPPPQPLAPGDRVKLARVPGRSPALEALVGATGEVVHVSGRRVVVRLDEPYLADGIPTRDFYSYPEELEPARRVGRLGSVDLYE
jgi:hypothetical protein